MKTVGIAVLAALAVALLVGPSFVEAARERRSSFEDQADQRWENLPEGRKAKVLAEAEARGLFARFSFDLATRQVSGKWVNFTWDNTTKSLMSYAVRNVTVLDSLTLGSSFTVTKIKAVGSVLRAKGPMGGIAVHNNPLGLVVFHANASLSVTFDLPTGASTVAFGEAGKSIRINYAAPNNATHAHVARLGNATITNTTSLITVTMQAGDGFLFAVHPPALNFAHHEKHFHDQIVAAYKGNYGGSIDVLDADGSTAGVPIDLGVQLSAESLVKGKAVVKATGEGKGRVLIIRLDPDMFPNAQIRVLIDGTAVSVGTNNTQTLAMVPTSAAASAEASPEGVTVAVAVASFSDHTITVESASTTTPTTTSPATSTTPTTTARPSPGVLAWAALAALGLAGVVLRRR